jgi:hypothetical protein
MKRALILALVAIAAAVKVALYLRIVRPRVLNWHATDEEIARTMPGDAILPDATLQTTRAITIEAPPSAIWPWLVQMGPRPRGGAYTYAWLERLLGIDIENSDRILPEFQHLEPGEYLGLNEKGEGLQVREVIDEHALVVQWIPALSTWTFALYPQDDGTTRLISRNRLRVNGLPARAGMVAFMEPGSLVMERKMLLGLKERAERLHRESTATGVAHAVEQPAH